MAPIPDDVDEDVLLELAAVVGCESANPVDLVWLISIDMDDRS